MRRLLPASALLLAPAAALAQASPSVDTFATRYDLIRREVGTIAPDRYGAGPLAYAATRNIYVYDGLGRMTHDLEGFGEPAFRLSYDAAGRRSGLALGAGPVTSTMSYVYDGVGRLQTLSRDLAGAGSDQVAGFAYNPASQMVSRTSWREERHARLRPARAAVAGVERNERHKVPLRRRQGHRGA